MKGLYNISLNLSSNFAIFLNMYKDKCIVLKNLIVYVQTKIIQYYLWNEYYTLGKKI